MLILNQDQVASLLDIDQLVDALAPAMAGLSSGAASQPPRTGAQVSERDGVLAVMPVYLNTSKALAVKLVSIFPQNAKRQIPTHQAIIAVFDAETGSPLAIMDGELITAQRTAAGSALATKLLARPDSEVLAILGTGVQAKAHAQIVPRVRPIKEIRIAGRDRYKAISLARELSAESDISIHGTGSYLDAVMGADVVCTTTNSPAPVLLGRWLEPGVHVNSVGLNFQGRELDNEAVLKSLVVVESRQSALAPSPTGANDLTWPIRDGVITEDHVKAEIGELVLGTRQGRTNAGEITLYKSVGVATQDAVAAQLVLTAALERGLGLEVAL